jgi:hypothetical protein
VNPYEHFFWNFAFFYRKPWAWKVGVGGVFPDLIYMVPFIPRILSYGSFLEWMHDPLWDTIWNSLIARSVHSLFVLSTIVILLLIILKRETFKYIFPFLLGWGLHIALDALTHVSDGYSLFFPLFDHRFPAPVSYWERGFHAREYFWISHSLMAGLFLLWIGWKLERFLHRRNLSKVTFSSKRGKRG